MTQTNIIPILNIDTTEADRIIRLNHELESRMTAGEFDGIPLEHACRISRMVDNNNIVSRWWERLLMHHLGWKKPGSTDGKDYGDLCAAPFEIGIDNLELKTNAKAGRGEIAAQQMRFFENIPWYMFVKLNPNDNEGFRTFILHKDDVHKEIFEYKDILPHVSQGSGKTKGKTDTVRRQMIQDTFDGNNDILWGFGFNMLSPNKQHVLTRWTEQYEVTVNDLVNWDQFKSQRLSLTSS